MFKKMKIKYELTKDQQEQYLKLKSDKPKMSELDKLITITGGLIFLGKTITSHLGYENITKIFMNLSQTFFWIIIIISVIKGIKKNFNCKTRFAGITQIVGSGISAFLMLR